MFPEEFESQRLGVYQIFIRSRNFFLLGYFSKSNKTENKHCSFKNQFLSLYLIYYKMYKAHMDNSYVHFTDD